MKQLALFEAHARRGDPDTSHDAAASITDLTARRAAVLDLLRRDGWMTDETIHDHYQDGDIQPPQSPSGLRTRRSELVTLGLVCDTGEREILRSGRRAVVWRAVDEPPTTHEGNTP